MLHDSVTEAVQASGIVSGGIVGCCKKYYKQWNGFKFRYLYEERDQTTLTYYTARTCGERETKTRNSVLVQYTIEGRIVNEFYSVKDAAEALGKKSLQCFYANLRGDTPTAYGYVWRWRAR